MVISSRILSRGRISITIELEEIFPGTFYLEKNILTTDFSGIIDIYFLQGAISWFINYNSNKKIIIPPIVNFIADYLNNKNVLKILIFIFQNFTHINLSAPIFGAIAYKIFFRRLKNVF